MSAHDDIQTVRGSIYTCPDPWLRNDGYEAAGRLAARIEQLAKERDEANAAKMIALSKTQTGIITSSESGALVIAELQARVAQLEGALREIADMHLPESTRRSSVPVRTVADAIAAARHDSREIARAALGAARPADPCQHGNQHFSRVLCACGAMHTYCTDCDTQLDECDEIPADTKEEA